jgi:hypothetical protein
MENSLRYSGSSAARSHGPAGAWSLWIVIPLDALGLYLILAAFDLIPRHWPSPHLAAGLTIANAVLVFALARAIALIALRRLLRWRHASDAWSRIAAARRAR